MSYQEQAQQTCSNQFHGELVNLSSLQAILYKTICDLQDLDLIKKALSYGKKNAAQDLSAREATCEDLPTLNIPANNAQIIHCIIGKATEAGELLELLYSSLFEGIQFDVTNFKEEIGDGQWYDAIGLNAIGATFEEVQATNIAKLRARFPNKFTEYDANNRDLVTERKILEQGS